MWRRCLWRKGGSEEETRGVGSGGGEVGAIGAGRQSICLPGPQTPLLSTAEGQGPLDVSWGSPWGL